MKRSLPFIIVSVLLIGIGGSAHAPRLIRKKAMKFSVLALAENGGHHILYSQAAKLWLNKLSVDSSFIIDYIDNPNSITESTLNKYQLFIQLDYPPYGWNEKAVAAFQQFIESGKIGWIGFHHASLLGEFDGYSMWQWFS